MEKPLTARKRQALEMRSRIQNVALDLFDRDGFENVAVEQIAQAAGCSVGNIYHYFKSKDELIIQVTSNVDAQYQLLEQSYLADNASSARSKLLDFVGKSLDISSKDPALYRSFIHGLKYPEQAILQDNESRVYFRVLRELIAACQQEGSIAPHHDPSELVADLVVMHRGMLFEWRIDEQSFDPGDPRLPDGPGAVGRLEAAGVRVPAQQTKYPRAPVCAGVFLCCGWLDHFMKVPSTICCR